MGATVRGALSRIEKIVKKVKNFWEEEEEFTTNTLASSRSEPLEHRKRKKIFLPRTTQTTRTYCPKYLS